MSIIAPVRFPLLALLLSGIVAMPVQSQPASSWTVPTDGTLLSVSAQAEASRVPDVATVSTGVVTQAVDGNTAMRDNAREMTRVMAAIEAAGIAERDVRTSGVSLHPQYRHEQNQPPRITGYQATNTVQVKVRDITRLGEIMDALAAQGANRINGPNFAIDEPEPVYDEARLAALQKAQERARTYAEALGLSVRRIVSISEDGGSSFHPMPMMAMRAADSAEMTTPVAPGENTVSVSLEVVFELGS